MIFRRYYNLKSKKSAKEVTAKLLGNTFNVHNLSFEITQRDNNIKVIPHAEKSEKIYTLPITRLKVTDNKTGSSIKMMSKPRRIDIGGPYLLLIFIFFAIVAAFVIYFYKKDYINSAYVLAIVALFTFIILWIRMEMGYFDYIRKIKKHIQSLI
ncbi:MAG: hypothetical protein R2831_12240 [Chitinophagaceae bacterium]